MNLCILKSYVLKKKQQTTGDERGSEMDLKFCELTGRENPTMSTVQATEDAESLVRQSPGGCAGLRSDWHCPAGAGDRASHPSNTLAAPGLLFPHLCRGISRKKITMQERMCLGKSRCQAALNNPCWTAQNTILPQPDCPKQGCSQATLLAQAAASPER